jgi:hypothetical protein
VNHIASPPSHPQNEIREILELQARNHPSALTSRTMADEGFVTVRHRRLRAPTHERSRPGNRREGRRRSSGMRS